MNMYSFAVNISFHFSRDKTAGSYVKYMFNFLGNHHQLFF